MKCRSIRFFDYFGRAFVIVCATIVAISLLTCCSSLTVQKPSKPPTDPLPSGYTRKQCNRYDSASVVWGGIAAGSGALSGMGALSTSFPEDRGVRVGIGIASLIVGAATAASVYLSHENAQRFSERCAEK